MHLRHRAVVILAIAATAVGLMVSTSAGAGGVSVTQTVTGQWNSGYQATMSIRNDTGAGLKGWRLEFDLPHHISSLWDAVLVGQTNNHVVVDAPSWQRDLAAGTTATFGYVASLNGTRQEPANCKINGTPCSVGSGSTGTSTSSTSTSTSTTVPSTTTSTTAPSGGALGGAPPFSVAPYADATLWPTVDLPSLARADGVRTYTLGFIVNGQGSCRATWGTYYN